MCKIEKYKICVIISGGQTGADRGGLDFAIQSGIKHGGWCPFGRIAEDKVIPPRYLLTETKTTLYPARTRMNIKDSDATLIFSSNINSKGTMLTTRFCIECQKPYYTVIMNSKTINSLKNSEIKSIRKDILLWLHKHNPEILNIAGTRESHCPGIAKIVAKILRNILIKSEKEKEWPPKRPTTPNLSFD